MKKISIWGLSLLGLTGCMTLSNNYEIQAFDEQGKRLEGPRIISQGSGIDTAKNTLCLMYPNAYLKVINLDKNTEIPNEEQPCHRNAPAKASKLLLSTPQSFNLAGATYYLTFESANAAKSTYEYTPANETVHNWSRLLTMTYWKQLYLSSQQYYELQIKQLEKNGYYQNPQFISEKGLGYFSVTYLPTDLKSKNLMASTYEVNVQKIFAQCGELVTLSIAERLQPNTPQLQTTLQKTRAKLINQLKADSWRPKCNL